MLNLIYGMKRRIRPFMPETKLSIGFYLVIESRLSPNKRNPRFEKHSLGSCPLRAAVRSRAWVASHARPHRIAGVAAMGYLRSSWLCSMRYYPGTSKRPREEPSITSTAQPPYHPLPHWTSSRALPPASPTGAPFIMPRPRPYPASLLLPRGNCTGRCVR